MGTLWQDIKYGFRMLVRTPGFTAMVVVILAIGIGATTAMLSVVDSVLLRPCPYKAPDTLVCVYETNNPMRNQRNFTSRAGFQDWREQNHVFEHLIGADQQDCTVQTTDRTEKTRAMFVSPGFFSVLGVQPVLGRTFLPEEEKPGGERVAVLSHHHWRHWFGGDPDVIGKSITVDKQLCTVVGVLPESFRWVFQGIACGLWMPMSLNPDDGTNRNSRGLEAIGRLKPSIDLAQAQAEMDLIASQLAQEYPNTNKDIGILVIPINKAYMSWAKSWSKPQTLVVLLGIVTSVLLMACLHVAGLLIARSATREKEIAVRAALGAGRLRLVRQLLSESALLAGLGALLGLLLAYWGIGILSALRERSIPWYLGNHMGRVIPWFVEVRMDARALLYITAISLLTCGFLGLLPAIGASKTNLSRSLSASRTPGRGPRFHSLRTLLVIGDIAIAFVLLIVAGLMINSYARILNIHPGYNPKNVLSVGVTLDETGPTYSRPERRLAFFQEVMERVRALPGAQLVAAANDSPVGGTGNVNAFKIEGVSPATNKYRIPAFDDLLPDKSYMSFPFWHVFPDYFRVMQIPLLKGRHFTEQDTAASQPVAIINDAIAQCFWPNENPVGKYILQAPPRDGSRPVARQIVGVVSGVKHFGRSEPSDPEVYIPYLQSGYTSWVDLMVRTDPACKDIAAAVRREILAVDRDVTISDFTFMDQEVSDFFSPQRFITLCLGGFAAVALALACMGVYGTTAYVVSQRTHEIGIRMALGARSSDVLKGVLRQGLRLTLIGVAVGLAGAFALTRIISSLLYDVSPTDPFTFVCVSLLLAGVALLASYIPARRAAKIDPTVALRYE